MADEAIAVDASTGQLLWRYRSRRLGAGARFEMYVTGLVVDEKLFLDPTTGKPIKPFNLESCNCLARSVLPFDTPSGRTISLDNGWKLSKSLRDDLKTLNFVDSVTGKAVWDIRTAGLPVEIACWKNFVFYTLPFSDEGVLYAYEAGAAAPSWTVDVNQTVKAANRPLTRLFIRVMGDDLYLQAEAHVFNIEPKTGQLHWHLDLAKDLTLRFDPDFFIVGRGSSERALFARAEDILVISFARRVVALNTRTMKCLWHMARDTFSWHPSLMIHDGKVFLSSGDKRRIYQAVPRDQPQQAQSVQTFRELDWHDVPLATDVAPWQELIDAILADDYEKAHQLIDAEADVKAKDTDQTTALHALARRRPPGEEAINQQTSLLKHLLKAGADIDAGSETGATPVSNAIVNKNEQLALELLKAGAKVTCPKGTRSPLHDATQFPALVQALIAAGADVNAQDHEGSTPLHKIAAGTWGQYDEKTYQVIRMLVEAGADLSIKDNEGRDPIQSARYRKNPMIADFMESLKKESKPKPPNRPAQPAPSRGPPAPGGSAKPAEAR